MSKWRKPGQPYTIKVDGIVLTCKPLSRGDALALAELSQSVPTEEGGVEAFYLKLSEQIVSIEGFTEPVLEVLEYQTHEIMLDIFKGIIGASSLSSDESKNSKPSLDTAEPKNPAGDAETVKPADAGTDPK